jgi:altronate dehydratase small subunit
VTATDTGSAGQGKSVLLCHPTDNVAIAMEQLESGDVVLVDGKDDVLEVRLQSRIPVFHKFSLRPIPNGRVVFKQGEAIGKATQDIALGEHVHVHNLSSLRALQIMNRPGF